MGPSFDSRELATFIEFPGRLMQHDRSVSETPVMQIIQPPKRVIAPDLACNSPRTAASATLPPFGRRPMVAASRALLHASDRTSSPWLGTTGE